MIAVHGAMDSSGYYTATFGGQMGLVPANFVQEVEVANPDTRQRLFDQVSSHHCQSVAMALLHPKY